METIPPQTNISFLQGRGEMIELTRQHNWAATSLGMPNKWPQSLRTTLSILLNSKFPMFLFWGEELICFYNDAYRPSLGNNGKHPNALGKPGEVVWPEIWSFIKPLIDQVLAGGEATWNEDQLLPIYRNGKMEDVYWTFSYSPVNDETGKPAGVFVTCSETTEKVKTINGLQISEQRFQNLIRDATVGIVVLIGKNMVVEIVNDTYGKIIERNAEELLGRPLFDIIPEAKPYFYDILENVRVTGEALHLHDYPYFVMVNGVRKDGFLNIVYQPYKENNGEITGVMAIVHDVTPEVQSRKKTEESEQQVRTLVENAPFPIGVYSGRDMKIMLANQSILDVWGKGNDVVGKRYSDILPELDNQEIFQQLDNVYTTGVPFHARNRRVDITINGKLKPFYFNYSFTPLYDSEGQVYGVMNTAADVTDLNLSKLKIEESERNFRSLILQAPVAICILRGADQVVKIVNERMLELMGKPAEVISNQPLFAGWAEAQGQGLEAPLQKVFETGEKFRAVEQRVRLPRDNKLETTFLNIACEALYETDGTISGVMMVAVEVTTQVLSRRKIEESEQRVRTMVQNAPFPIGVYIGKEMRIELANQSIIDTWGKGNDVVGKLYKEMLPELGSQTVFQQLDDVYTSGIPFHAKNKRVELKSGDVTKVYFFNYNFTPLLDANGKVYGIMSTAADVTDLNIAKQKVEESERNMRMLILQAPVAICIFRGPEYVLEIVNEQMADLMGRPASALQGKPFFDALPEVKEQGLEPILEQVIITKQPYISEEQPFQLPRGEKLETFYVRYIYEPLFDTNNSVSGIMVVASDVSEQVIARHKIEEVVTQRTKELAEVNSSLQRSNAELAQFAYIASHDLQEPVRKITTFTEMLERSLGTIDERSFVHLSKIKIAASRMLSLIRDVLDFSQLSKDQQPFQPVNLVKVIQDCVNDFELAIEQKGATILLEGLPGIEAIPLQMAQLFSNLFSNALKFSYKDKPPVITISAYLIKEAERKQYLTLLPNAAYYHLVFKDNGIGFKQEYADQIFKIFQRLHGKTEFEGTGIGLALCKKIIENHNGIIWATASNNGGAAFHIILPQRQPNPQQVVQ